MRARFALALLTFTVFGSAPTVAADDALIETGAIESGSLAGGAGWVVWATHRPDGLLRLRGVQGQEMPDGLHVPPFSRIGSVDVGRGPHGTPTAVYDACRSFCHVYTLDLSSGVERRITLPRLPRGCQYANPVIDGRVFILRLGLRSPAPRRCGEGIYELRRSGRLRRIQPGIVVTYDISGGRFAYQQENRRGVVFIVARRLGRRGRTVVDENETQNYDGGVVYDLAWQGRRLWLGAQTTAGASGSTSAYVWQLGVEPRLVCRRDDHRFFGTIGRNAPVPSAWAFADSAIYYTIDGAAGVELRRRTEPAPRWVPCF